MQKPENQASTPDLNACIQRYNELMSRITCSMRAYGERKRRNRLAIELKVCTVPGRGRGVRYAIQWLI